MEQIKQPSMMRIAFGSMSSWWVASIINPGFFAVAVMLLLMIPLVLWEFYFTFYSPQKKTVTSAVESEQKTQENSA
jgi:hypothetical protein